MILHACNTQASRDSWHDYECDHAHKMFVKLMSVCSEQTLYLVKQDTLTTSKLVPIRTYVAVVIIIIVPVFYICAGLLLPCLEISVKYSSIVNVFNGSGELDEPIEDQCLLKHSLQLPPLTDLGI